MINSGREWDWMDDRIHQDIEQAIVEEFNKEDI